MAYGKSSKVFTRVKSHMDEILLSKHPSWILSTKNEASTFAYALRNAFNYARKNNILPYAAQSVTIKQDGVKVFIVKSKGWVILAHGGENIVTKEEIRTFTDLALYYTSLGVKVKQYIFPSLSVTEPEQELFNEFLVDNDLVVTSKFPMTLTNAVKNYIPRSRQ